MTRSANLVGFSLFIFFPFFSSFSLHGGEAEMRGGEREEGKLKRGGRVGTSEERDSEARIRMWRTIKEIKLLG